MEELEKIVAANLTALRKKKMWTQAELAVKINYSDKSVSKWERGEALPDLKVLKQLADLFGVTVDFFLAEDASARQEKYISSLSRRRYQLWVTALAITLVWLIATVIYVYVAIYGKTYVWESFTWALPASAIVLFFFDCRYFGRRGSILILSALIWTLITAIFLQWIALKLWMLYIVGIPAQAVLLLMAQIRHSK